MRFKNRLEAGKELAESLLPYKGTHAVIYALPRGGVVLGFKIAEVLGVPLDLVITRKIGHPHNPEYAVCAVAGVGELLCDESARGVLDSTWLRDAVERERKEILRRSTLYMSGRLRLSPRNKIAIVVDDGIATGLTIRAAIKSLRKEHPEKIIVAVPVAPHDVVLQLKKEVDDVVLLEDTHDYLGAVGTYYDDFPQVSDAEVIQLLKQGNTSHLKKNRP